MVNLNNPDQKLSDMIINVAYGDAGIIEKIVVYWKVAANDEVKRLLEEYKATANSVHGIKAEELSQGVVEFARRRIELEKGLENLFSKLYFAFISKPILSAASVIIIVLTLAAVFFFKQPPTTHKYTKAEIELAQQQFERSLAIVGRVLQNAENKLEIEVISKHVSKPLNKGLNYLNDYLIGG